jgi:hypothetical protein
MLDTATPGAPEGLQDGARAQRGNTGASSKHFKAHW